MSPAPLIALALTFAAAGREPDPGPGGMDHPARLTLAGDTIPLVYRQRGREVRAVLRLKTNPWLEVRPAELAGETISEEQHAFRAAWLGSRARPERLSFR
jgi:hypothetical protein